MQLHFLILKVQFGHSVTAMKRFYIEDFCVYRCLRSIPTTRVPPGLLLAMECPWVGWGKIFFCGLWLFSSRVEVNGSFDGCPIIGVFFSLVLLVHGI